MNEDFIREFYSSVCFIFRNEDGNGGYQNNVCFSTVDEKGHYMICLKEEDHDGGLLYQCFHKVLLDDFNIPGGSEDEIPGDCFSLQDLRNDIETMKNLNPVEVALAEIDEVPDCVRRIAAIAEYEDASVTEQFLPVGRACAEIVLSWKKTIADRFFDGLLMADAGLISVFFKLAKEYANEKALQLH